MSVQRVFFGTDLTFEDVSSVLFRELQGYFLTHAVRQTLTATQHTFILFFACCKSGRK